MVHILLALLWASLHPPGCAPQPGPLRFSSRQSRQRAESLRSSSFSLNAKESRSIITQNFVHRSFRESRQGLACLLNGADEAFGVRVIGPNEELVITK